MSIDLNRDNYDSEVTKSKGVVMVDFWGPLCKPCLALMPAVDKLEGEYAQKIKVAKVNAQENRMLCATLRVISLPSYLFYKDGIEVNRLTGEHLTEKDLEKAIKEALS